MRLLLRKAVSRLPAWLPFRHRPDFTLMRAHERHSCCLIASLAIIERGIELEGIVTEVSLGGMLFREASDYIYDRGGAAIRIRVAGLDCSGTIVNVRPSGYGVRLARDLTSDELNHILTEADPGMPATEPH